MILFKGKKDRVLIFYVIALIIAIYVAIWSSSTGYTVVSGGEKLETAGLFFFYIIIATAFFLLMIKLLQDYIRVVVFLLELLFLFSTSSVFFSIALGDTPGLVWGLFLVIIRTLLGKLEPVRNLSVSIISGVSAGLVGASLSPITSLTLYLLLVLYDFASVFVTGHMVRLAKSIENIKEGGEKVALGAGDLVMPALFSSSFVGIPVVAIISAIGALLGVLLAFRCLKKFNRPLPALPYISAVQIPITALALYLSTLLPGTAF